MNQIRPIDLSPVPLPDCTPICRYVSLKTLFLNLSGKVFVPSISTLRKGDPFEAEFYYGDHPGTFISALDKWHGAEAENIWKWILNDRFSEWHRNNARIEVSDQPDLTNSWFPQFYFEFIRATRYSWCWFAPESGGESAAMWNTYGKEGAIIRTTVGQLSNALIKTSRDFEYGRMHYVHANDFGCVGNLDELAPRGKNEDSGAILRPHFFKRAEYLSENEVRFVTADDERDSGGILLELPPAEWINEIRLWPGLSLSESKALEEIVGAKMPRVKCSRSGMLKRGLEEGLSALAEETSGELPWRQKADGIPTSLKFLSSSGSQD